MIVLNANHVKKIQCTIFFKIHHNVVRKNKIPCNGQSYTIDNGFSKKHQWLSVVLFPLVVHCVLQVP